MAAAILLDKDSNKKIPVRTNLYAKNLKAVQSGLNAKEGLQHNRRDRTILSTPLNRRQVATLVSAIAYEERACRLVNLLKNVGFGGMKTLVTPGLQTSLTRGGFVPQAGQGFQHTRLLITSPIRIQDFLRIPARIGRVIVFFISYAN